MTTFGHLFQKAAPSRLDIPESCRTPVVLAATAARDAISRKKDPLAWVDASHRLAAVLFDRAVLIPNLNECVAGITTAIRIVEDERAEQVKHPKHSEGLLKIDADLAVFLCARGEKLRNLNDLARAVQIARVALEYVEDESNLSLRARFQYSLAYALRLKFEVGHDPAFLPEAITAYREAARVAERLNDKESAARSHVGLAMTLMFLISQYGQVGLADEALAALDRAERLAPAVPRSLGYSYRQGIRGKVNTARGMSGSDAGILLEAVQNFRNSMLNATRATLGWEFSDRRLRIAMLLNEVAKTRPEPAYLEDAKRAAFDAMATYEGTRTDDNWIDLNRGLSEILTASFTRSGNVQEIDDAIRFGRTAAAMRPAQRHRALLAKDALAMALLRHPRTPVLRNAQNEAVALLTERLESLAAERPGYAWRNCQHRLGVALETQGKCRNDEAILRRSMSLQLELIPLIPRNSDELVRVLSTVGNVAISLHDVTKETDLLQFATTNFKRAHEIARDANADPRMIIRTATNWTFATLRLALVTLDPAHIQATISLAERAIALRSAQAEGGTPVEVSFGHLGSALLLAGELDHLDRARQLLQLALKEPGLKDHPKRMEGLVTALAAIERMAGTTGKPS